MKILIFYRSLNQGGVQRMMVNFANHLAEINNDVTLLLIRKEGEFIHMVSPKVKLEQLPMLKYSSIIPSLSKILKEGNFDVLFTATPSLNIAAILAKKIAKVKTKILISERSSTLKEFFGTKFGLYKISFLAIPFLYRFADGIVAVSKGVADDIAKIALISKKKTTVIYNPAFDKKALAQISDNVGDDWLKNEKEIPVIISAGRLAHQKNFKVLIDAFNIIIKKGRPARLIILGDGELRADLIKQIEELKIGDKVKLPGFKSDPIAWISKADVFVLSSLWEGFGNILVDALGAQTTIVSTNCKSGPSEILDNGKFGYLTDSFAPEELAKKIEYAIENPIKKERLLERANSFEMGIIMTQYENLLKSLIH